MGRKDRGMEERDEGRQERRMKRGYEGRQGRRMKRGKDRRTDKRVMRADMARAEAWDHVRKEGFLRRERWKGGNIDRMKDRRMNARKT